MIDISQHRWLSRRGVVVAVFAAAMMTLIAPASAAEKLNVGKAVPEAFSFVPVDVGLKEGIFAKHGLDVTSIAFTGDAKLQQAMIAGSLDIALGSGPAMAFIAKGSPIKAVGALTGAPSLMTIVVKADGPIKTVANLKGKKVSVSTAGSLTAWLTTETSRREGWGNAGIKVEPMGSMQPQIAALMRGDIDGVVTDIATALDLEARHKARIVIRFGDVIHDFHTNVIFATDKLIQNRPQALKAFLAAWYGTIAYMGSHRAEAVKISADVMKKSLSISEKTYDVLMPVFSTDGKFDPQALATLRKSYVAMKLVPTEPDMSKLIDTRFLPSSK